MGEAKSTDQGVPSTIRFDYIKSNFFRVIYTDGIIGGLTPRGAIHIDVWSQRMPIPRGVVHEIGPDGTLGAEIVGERDVRNAIVREVEVGIVLDLEMAKSVIKWLQDQVKQLEIVLETKKDQGEDH